METPEGFIREGLKNVEFYNPPPKVWKKIIRLKVQTIHGLKWLKTA